MTLSIDVKLLIFLQNFEKLSIGTILGPCIKNKQIDGCDNMKDLWKKSYKIIHIFILLINLFILFRPT